MRERWRNLWLLGRWLPRLAGRPADRRRLAELRAFCRGLPARLREPLPEAMRQITPAPPLARPVPHAEDRLRDLADLAAILERGSPLGLCLRRSLTRYHVLAAAGLPLTVHFGAKLQPGEQGRDLTGHAWLTLDDRPYHEADEHWRGFTSVYRWPAPDPA